MTTALANLVGYYEYEYSGADDLDLVCLFHTSDTTTDQQDLVSYVVDKVYQVDTVVDAIKAKTDLMDASAITYTANVVGTAITLLRGDTFTATMTDVGALTGYVSIDFTVKRNTSNTDDEAVIRIRKTQAARAMGCYA